jgi:REP element-mobilizing transposase RayT
MRREPFEVGSYVHVMKRGTRGLPITRDNDDRWRFLKLLRYLNDKNVPRNWERDIGPDEIRNEFARPAHWPAHEPLVSILSFTLMDNHFHLLLKERTESGISMFMQRVCTSMALFFNAKYHERGTMFQSSYLARTVQSDEYLRYLVAYIAIKNPLERDRNIRGSMRDFKRSVESVSKYQFSSLAAHLGHPSVLLSSDDILDDYTSDVNTFLAEAYDMLNSIYGSDSEFGRLAMLDIDT